MDNVIAQNEVIILLQLTLYLQPPLHNRDFFCPGGQKINPYLDSLLNRSPQWLDMVIGDVTARTYVPIDLNPFITHQAHERLYHTTGVYAPYSLRTAVWVLLRPTRIKTEKELWDRAFGFFRPYPIRLEILTVCRCHNKGSTFSLVVLRSWVLVWPWFEHVTSRSADRHLR